MEAVELRVEPLAKLLAEMRAWIDRVRPGHLKFENERSPGGETLVRMRFSQEDFWLCVAQDWRQEAVAV